jgi:hypothetical protein
MGVMVQPRLQLGASPTGSIVGTSLSTAGTVTAGSAIAAGAAAGSVVPIVGTIIGAVGGLIASLMNFGYNPQKLNDTAVTEGAQMLWHQLWYQLTGEDLGGGGGGGCTCTPGKCGDQHCAIFTPTNYPDVPFGPLGDTSVDIDAVIQKAQSIYQEAVANLQRPESLQGIQDNFSYLLDRFNDVKAARAASPAGVIESFLPPSVSSMIPASMKPYLPLIAGGALLLLLR